MTARDEDDGMPLFARGSDTSETAARTMREPAAKVRERVLSFIAARGSRGATCDEVERELNMSHQCASPRIHELHTRGVIVNSGMRRRTRSNRPAVVWVKGMLP